MGQPLDFVKARFPQKNANLDPGQRRSDLLVEAGTDIPETARESNCEDGQ
jgi:hypothetical protein